METTASNRSTENGPTDTASSDTSNTDNTDTSNTDNTGRTTTASVGPQTDWDIGSMKMRKVGDHSVAVARTESGFHAVDNACPHQGYGLVTGALDGELVTCQWHNWKFDVRTGQCVMGEEDVACHKVELRDGEVFVQVTAPSDAERQEQLWPSLERGISAHYVGQVSRDSVRLLETGVTPTDIMASGVRSTVAKSQWGIDHALAMATDCLALAEIRHGTERALPLVQGLAGLSETTRDRPVRPVPDPDGSIDVPAAIESEDAEGAMAGVLGAIHDGVDPATIRHQLIDAASAHHLSYGHGLIYTQKTFEFLDRVGWGEAPEILPHLAASLVWSTREDTLPYMSKAMQRLATVDLEALTATSRQAGWEPTPLVDLFLDATAAPMDEAVAAAANGAGIDGLLDAVSLGASHRLLRHDLQVELDRGDPFGWLDITHALTTAQAVRWAWQNDPGPHTARAALFAVWLLFDAGRAERRNSAERQDEAERQDMAEQRDLNVQDAHRQHTGNGTQDLASALLYSDPEGAVALAMAGDQKRVGEVLTDAALADRAGSFIVAAHLVKTTEAARREAAVTGSSLPLAATARFLAAPRVERFIAGNVAESIGFVTTGKPPAR